MGDILSIFDDLKQIENEYLNKMNTLTNGIEVIFQNMVGNS